MLRQEEALVMGKKRIKPNYHRRVLRIPDLNHCKLAVLQSQFAYYRRLFRLQLRDTEGVRSGSEPSPPMWRKFPDDDIWKVGIKGVKESVSGSECHYANAPEAIQLK